ncbi:MAG: PilZ domain-containing protein [Myxococcales bacterium]|nr:PilZ domain-containing protein [Myxococcales bacterium]
MVPMEQRRAARRSVVVECQVVRERDFRLVGESTLDLSPEGMLVLTNDRVLTGEDLLVSFRTPILGTWFDAEARVARVVHGRRPGDFGRALGLRFKRLDRIAKSLLEASLSTYRPSPPSRAPRVDYAESVTRIIIGAA